jgi:glycosyltransferase involved in cell wall biosynthesis
MGSQSTDNFNARPLVSVAVSTYNRGQVIKYMLDGLKRQTYKNFEVVIVLKPSGDGTEKILEKYAADLPIKLVLQKKGTITNAYNLSIKNSEGEIIVFLDDDAVACPNLLEEYVKTYNKYENVGGISGPAESAIIKDGKVVQLSKKSISSIKPKYSDFPWSRPVSGMSNWLIYFGKDGLVHHHFSVKEGKVNGLFPSLLFMGANMSFRKAAIDGLTFDEDTFLGFACEQLFSYKIWSRGYKLLFNSNARVSHLVQDDTLGRFYKSPKRATLRDAEFVLTFPAVRSHEGVSMINCILSIITIIFAYVLKIRKYGFTIVLHRIYGLVYGFVLSCALIFANSLGSNFSKTNALAELYG